MAANENRQRGSHMWLKSSTADSAESADKPGSQRKSKKGSQRPKTMAELADKHQLYMKAVQNPRSEVKNLNVIYSTLCGRYSNYMDDVNLSYRRYALTLREDFCGTAVLCAEWVRSRSLHDRRAFGIDIDPEVIEYAQNHVVNAVDDGSRIQLVCGDVLDVGSEDGTNSLAPPRVDIIAAFNFSVCYFHQRCDLVRYLTHSLNNLRDFGLLFCDIFGGAEATQSQVRRVRDLGSFKYQFQQHSYDLQTNIVHFSLGFKMKDGSMLKDCFTYKFRIYSLCELKEAMLEAGFSRVSIWIATKRSEESSNEASDGERSSDEDEGSAEFGEFAELTSAMEMPHSFNAYVVGVKLPHTKELKV